MSEPKEAKDKNNQKEDTKKLTLDDALTVPSVRKEFTKFLEKELCDENICFWLDLEQFTEETDPKVRQKYAKDLYKIYIDRKEAPKMLNISGPVALEIQKQLTIESNFTGEACTIFEEAKEQVFKILATDCFPRFVKACVMFNMRSSRLNHRRGTVSRLPSVLYDQFAKECEEKDPEKWKFSEVRRDVKVYMQDYDSRNSLVKVKAIARIATTAKKIYDLVMDVSKIKSYDKVCTFAKVLRQLDKNTDLLHIMCKMPSFLSRAREFTLLRTVKKSRDGFIVISRSVLVHQPKKKNQVRAESIMSGFYCKVSKTHPNTCDLTYMIQVDLKGKLTKASFNAAISNRASTLIRIRKMLDPSFQPRLKKFSKNNAVKRGINGVESIDDLLKQINNQKMRDATRRKSGNHQPVRQRPIPLLNRHRSKSFSGDRDISKDQPIGRVSLADLKQLFVVHRPNKDPFVCDYDPSKKLLDVMQEALADSPVKSPRLRKKGLRNSSALGSAHLQVTLPDGLVLDPVDFHISLKQLGTIREVIIERKRERKKQSSPKSRFTRKDETFTIAKRSPAALPGKDIRKS
mmetsp:Transcript_13775/g.15204  ORF Transcript_13775/g.15204 Transcript_13775/m.15204 type:complete len:573 (+) Transcript_13775:41-1759(+)